MASRIIARRRREGFTLLEVMVAVAILALSLTAILSAQAGCFKASSHARNINVAVGLARCRMSELEEHLARDGYQLTDEIDQGPCCDGDGNSIFRCTWRVEQPKLPEQKYGDLNLSSSLGDLGALGVLAGTGGPGAPGGSPFGSSDLKSGDISQILAVANQAIPPPVGGDPLLLGPDGGNAGLTVGAERSGPSGASASPVGGLASIVMGMIYPDLKALFEASTRRVTVVAVWREGIKEYSVDLVQWVTSPQVPAPPPGGDDDGGAFSQGSSSSSSAGSSSSGRPH